MGTIVWLENELRLSDHAAFHRAATFDEPVIPVFIYDDETIPSGSARPSAGADWADGSSSRWWLHHSLVSMQEVLGREGLHLVVRRGNAAEEIRRIAAETGAMRVVWNARYEPRRHERDLTVARFLRENGLDVRLFGGALLHDPDSTRTDSGSAYQVFTPFWKRLSRELQVPEPLPAPHFRPCHRLAVELPSLPVAALELLPKSDWAGGLRAAWTPGEPGAQDRLSSALRSIGETYADRRNDPAGESTSRLSAHLHFGELSPREVWAAAKRAHGADAEAFLRQVAWREFAFHVLTAHPDLPTRPMRPAFGSFPWSRGGDGLRRWQRGETGFPLVDAGMRELWSTGWMHNRVRMVVASFLTKDLLVSWQEGTEWFRDTLVDADLANNTFGWQWTAGCGADAQPFFRIFNPGLQGRRYDPAGAYVRRWVPQLARLDARYVHEPWKASPGELRAAGVVLGESYPFPMVDHDTARKRALAAFASLA